MANAEHLKILKEGVERWNLWREENKKLYPNLIGASLHNIDLHDAYLSGTDLSYAALMSTNMSGADISGTDLRYANLSDAKLFGANLRSSNLSNAQIRNADLSSADLRDANLYSANIRSTNLSSSNLCDADLRNTDLSSVNLQSANLIKTNLRNANLRYANLRNANLNGVNLSGADLSGASLRNADLTGADLTGANLSSTKMRETNLGDAKIRHTIFGLADLSTCLGLESVEVRGPCSIDFQTLRASKNLPKSFLLKIGLPALYLDYLPDFFQNEVINYYPSFLSHAHTNKPFARKLYEALIARGVNVFFDEKKMKPGDDIFTGISRGIELYDKTILVCSEDSLNSWWVDQELELVFEKERKLQKETGEKTGLLIPIRIDDHIDSWNSGKRMAIKQRIIGDFRNWEDEARFEQELTNLIHALNADRPEIKPVSHLKKNT